MYSSSLQLFETVISAKCVFSEFSSLQWTCLPLVSAAFPWIHVNFEHLQYPVVRNYAVYLCVWRTTSFCLFGTCFLLILCPLLLLLEDSYSPFQYQSRINKHVSHIPELSLPNWRIPAYLVSTTVKTALYLVVLTPCLWMFLSSVAVFKDGRGKNFSI